MAEALSPMLSAEQEARVTHILERCCAAELRLTTAESCTGGLIASLLTDVPGCSHAFEAGFVTYTDPAKVKMLGVDPALLETKGAVSAEVALAMIDGALNRSRAHIAISLTGYTGTAEPGNEAGLVYIGGGSSQGERIIREHHFGDIGRGPARLACVDAALDMADTLLQRLKAE